MYARLLNHKNIIGKVLNTSELEIAPWLSSYVVRFIEKDSRVTMTKRFHKSEIEIITDYEVGI